MPIQLLVMFIFLSCIAMILGFVAWVTDEQNCFPGIFPALATVIFLVLTVWGGIYINTPWERTRVVYTPITTNNGIQFIVYADENNQLHLLNITEKYKKMFSSNAIVSISIYSNGPYVGLKTEDHHIFTIIE